MNENEKMLQKMKETQIVKAKEHEEPSVELVAHDPVPYIVFEGEMTRAERKFNKVFWALIFTIILFVATNAGWIAYETQFEKVSTTVTQEVSTEGGGDAIINGDKAGAVIYGESETNSDNNGQTPEDGR